MEHLWIFLILLYGIFKGLREALKKKAMETNSVIEVLFFYTFFAFLLTIPFSQDVFSVSLKYHAAIIIKSFAIFIAWLCALNSIKRLPLSVYSVMDMGRMVFSILLGVIFLNENLRFLQIVGIALVITGITLVNLKKEKKADGNYTYKVIPLVLVSCILNALSGTLDKFLLTPSPDRFIYGTEVLTASQLQFWYMLYLVSFYLIYIIVKKEKIDVKKCLKCPWIYVLSTIFIIADRALFIANASPNSSVIVMTPLKQSSVIVSIILGRLIYKEKNILYRTLCALLIICGIVISIL